TRHLPYFCRGEVVKGFGRGFKELGIPTGERGARWNGATRVSSPLKATGEGPCGGWRCLSRCGAVAGVSPPWEPGPGRPRGAVPCPGGARLPGSPAGGLLLFFSFSEALISAIQEDIEGAKRQLDLPEHLKLKEDNFFHLPEGKTANH
ncbi:RIFK kinase, partial [Rostratula benghalensis]|nr:RIFK kinase [Rostratula benghalensis]